MPHWTPPETEDRENGLTTSENSGDLQLGASASNLLSSSQNKSHCSTNNKNSVGNGKI